MAILLYDSPRSPPCRAVKLLAKTLGIALELKKIETLKGDSRTPDFLKMNPQHCIPTIIDNGFTLWESRAILTYLHEKYAKNDSLYPKDLQKRALVDQRLYFDLGVLNAGFFGYYVPVLRTGKFGDAAMLTKAEDGFQILDRFLEGNNWVAGNNITIADYSIVSVVSSFDVLGFDVTKWKNVSAWYKRAQETIVGYDEINRTGCEILKQCFDECKK